MCDQQRLRSACAYIHLEFLSLTGGFTGSSESTLVKMLLCWKSHVVAQLINNLAEERGCSVVECLTRDGGVAGSSLNIGTSLCP